MLLIVFHNYIKKARDSLTGRVADEQDTVFYGRRSGYSANRISGNVKYQTSGGVLYQISGVVEYWSLDNRRGRIPDIRLFDHF